MTTPPADFSPLDLEKRDLRARMLAARRCLFAQGGAAAALELPKHFAASPLAATLQAGQVAAGYWPMGEEIDPRLLLVHLASQMGVVTALPVVVRRDAPLDFRRWATGDRLECGPHGTRHPTEDSPVLAPDMVLLPLLAFDRHGGRLGYGGGYYDRSLEYWRARRPVLTVGIAFAAQQVDSVPRGDHDQALDWVLTEQGLLKIGQTE